jgi:hypothetical protein
LGWARTRPQVGPRMFQIGIQYLPVDSMQTSRQLFCVSQPPSRSRSFMKVENRLRADYLVTSCSLVQNKRSNLLPVGRFA